MKRKKGFSIIMALILSLSVSVTTLAAEVPEQSVPGNNIQTEDSSVNTAETVEGELESEEVQDDSSAPLAQEGEFSQAGKAVTQEEVAVQTDDMPAEEIDVNVWNTEDFTYGEISHTLTGCDYKREIIVKGQGITGLSETGLVKIQSNKNLVLPSQTPDGTTIVGVGESAFKDQGIRTVQFPENMMVPYDDTLTGVINKRGNFIIKSSAFMNNNIADIEFPEGIFYIDSMAFKNNQLSNVTFPHTLWMIGNSAFANNQITTVNFCMNPDFMFQIDAFAFAYNQIKSVTIPNYLEKLTMYVFMQNPGMEPIPDEAPEKLKSQGGLVYMYTQNPEHFYNDRIHHLERTASNQKSWFQKLILGEQPEENPTWSSEDFTYDGTVITGLSESGIAKRETDRNLILPNKNPDGEYITEIAAGTVATKGTFSSAEEVFESVKLPAMVEKIGDYAFFGNELTSVSFPKVLKSIGSTAFAQNRLTSVTLPDSVETIGAGVFSGQKDSALTSVKLSKNLKEIPQSAFATCAITNLEIPEGVTKIGRMAFTQCPLTSLTLPSTLETIDSNAFKGHFLTSLTIPGSVKVISSSAFAQLAAAGGGNASLTELKLQEGVQEIGSSAFENSGLTKVVLPSSMTKVNAKAFKGSTAVVELLTDNYGDLSDKTNFPDSDYHILKFNTENWNVNDFTYDETGKVITGLSEAGVVKRSENKKLVLPDQNADGEDIVGIAGGDYTVTYGTFGAEGEVFESVKLPVHLQTIGDRVFLNNNLTSVEFPETLTSIGLQAFSQNNLSEIVLPNSVTILGGAAFSNNQNISKIQLSSQLTQIPATAFGITLTGVQNANLTSVTIPEGVETIGNGAFGGHEITSLVLPASLKKIDSKAFNGNRLESIVIPDNVTELGSYAFAQNSEKSCLTSVKLPEGLLKINSNTFAYASLTRVDIPFTLTTLNKAAFNGNATGLVQVYTPNDDHIKFAVAGATFQIHLNADVWTVNDFTYDETDPTVITGLSEKGLNKRADNRNLVLPDKNATGEYITAIAAGEAAKNGVFGSAEEQIEGVKLPAKLKKIGAYAFQNNKLTEIQFPETLEEIGLAAFQMNQLVNIVLPDSVTAMGGGAFGTNPTIQSVTISKNLKDIPAGAFGCSTATEYMTGFTSVEIPEGVETIGNNAFAGNNFTEIVIPATVKSIGNYAFSTKNTLTASTTVSLPEGLETIGECAFRNQNIASIDLPYNVSALSDNVFLKEFKDGSSGVTTIRVENYTQYTDKEKFPDSEYHTYAINADTYKATDFTYDEADDSIVTGLSESGQLKRALNQNLVIPAKSVSGTDITKIAAGQAGSYGVFATETEKFSSVTFPETLKEIGNYAFLQNNLGSVTFPEGLECIGIQAFGMNLLEEIVLPDSVTTLGGGAFASNANIREVVLSKGLTDIPASAFVNNTPAVNFTSIEIPEGIKTIGNFAFSGHSFTEVTIPAGVTRIGTSAFAQSQGHSTLTKVNLPSGLQELGSKAFNETALTRIDIPNSLIKLSKTTFNNTSGIVVQMHTSNKAHLENASGYYASSNWHQAVYDQLVESGWSEDDFTYDGVVITGWSEKGNQTRLENHKLVLPSVNPQTGEDITMIGEEAFKIPDSEWEQGKNGVYSPNGMESVLLPERLISIGKKAFQYNSLTTVEFPKTVTTVSESAFNSNKLQTLTLPDTITELGDGAFSTNELTALTLSKGLTRIPQAAFSMNINMTYVEIPNTITEIDDFAFAGARLETLYIPSSVKRIGRKAFHLHHLTELTVPGNVKEIGESAFEGTYKALTLKKLVLEEGIVEIDSKAFKEGYLETVELPSTLASLAPDAFMNNTGVDDKYVVECTTTNPLHQNFPTSETHKIVYSEAEWESSDFIYGDGKEIAVNVITGFSEQGLEKLANVRDLVLPEKTEEDIAIEGIADDAFTDLPYELMSVIFADGLKSIGENAFAANHLAEVKLPETVHDMKASSFEGNTDMYDSPIVVQVYVTAKNQITLPESESQRVIFVTGKYGWQQDSTGLWYRNADGSWPSSRWQLIGGEWYYFNASGYAVTGWKAINGAWYYFDEETGIMAADAWVDGDNYYVTSDGSMKTGWLKLGSNWYYLNGSGAKVKGWASVNGVWYYMDKTTGIMAANEWVDGDNYYVTSDGSMKTGWLKLGNDWYYLNGSGAKVKGWASVNGVWYYMDKTTGIMAANEWVDGDNYYVTSDGSMKTGWLKLGNDWYYLNGSGAKVKGWASVNGVWYYMDKTTGIMAANEWVDGDNYYVTSDGSMVANKWIQVEENWYYLNASGFKITNQWVGNYYLKADGTMAVSEWVDHDKYYVDANGVWVPNKTK